MGWTIDGLPLLCSLHGRPVDRCEMCERSIADREYELKHGEGAWEPEQDRYEAWLDEIGGSR